MAGLIRFDNGRDWSVGSWAYKRVRDFLDAFLTEQDAPQIKAQVSKDLDVGVLMLDLRGLPPGELSMMCNALRRLLDNPELPGAPTLDDDESRRGFADAIRELLECAGCG